MNNLWSQKCSELRSHSQHNIKLSIITSLEQRESMLRGENCFEVADTASHQLLIADTASHQRNSLQVTKTSFKRLLQ